MQFYVPTILVLCGSDAILPSKGIGQKTPSRLGQRSKGRPQGSHDPQGRFRAHGQSMSPLIFVNIRIGFCFVWALYFGHSSIIEFSPCISVPLCYLSLRDPPCFGLRKYQRKFIMTQHLSISHGFQSSFTVTFQKKNLYHMLESSTLKLFSFMMLQCICSMLGAYNLCASA